MRFTEVSCSPFEDQQPGTAGLRKKVEVFSQPHYLEMFIQAILDSASLPRPTTLVLGGDGRYFNREAIQRIACVCAANGVSRLIVGQHGLLSTPAASHLIRDSEASGGFILTASHNPGGPRGDFGIKFNVANGGQAPESLTEAAYDRTRSLTGYRLAELPALDLECTGSVSLGNLAVDIVDPVTGYTKLVSSLFDFDLISGWLRSGHRLHFDALNGITGPYATHIFCEQLGAPPDSIANAIPLEDFGGLHPDPNPAEARHLVDLSNSADPPDLIAASDGDGDRNMIIGPGLVVSPCDSVAVIAAHAHQLPGYTDGLPGVARSMPTSRALDTVAKHLGIDCYETPTGWRFFCNLLEAGRIGLCGEESFGTSSMHAREKDGIWAVLCWLNILALENKSVAEVVQDHWQRFGRHFYRRHDYFTENSEGARELMTDLRARLGGLPESENDLGIDLADDFHYRDPVDGSESAHQGVRIALGNGSRMVFRLSGTGTSGATLRVYLERYTREPAEINMDIDDALAGLATHAARIARIRDFVGLSEPTAVV